MKSSTGEEKNRNRQSTDKKQRKATKSLINQSFEPFIRSEQKKEQGNVQKRITKRTSVEKQVHDFPCEHHRIGLMIVQGLSFSWNERTTMHHALN